MKILIEKISTDQLYQGDGQWTLDENRAKNFENVIEATNACQNRGLTDVHIHMAFDNPTHDVFLAVPARDD